MSRPCSCFGALNDPPLLLLPELHKVIKQKKAKEEKTAPAPRDVGQTLNDSLTQTLRRLSVKASVVRRQSQRIKGVGADGGPRRKSSNFSGGLAPMREEGMGVGVGWERRLRV